MEEKATKTAPEEPSELKKVPQGPNRKERRKRNLTRKTRKNKSHAQRYTEMKQYSMYKRMHKPEIQKLMAMGMSLEEAIDHRKEVVAEHERIRKEREMSTN